MTVTKILRPICAGVAGIFFPIGRIEDGGTCEYASEKCLKHCYALEKDYDETVNIPEEEKAKIYHFITEKPLLDVCKKIRKEMDGQQAKILSWFTSGDCPNKDIDRLYKVICLLDGAGVIQNGFTRNEGFYRRLIGKGIKHFALTRETTISSKDFPSGLWAIPNYKKGEVKLYYGELGRKSESYIGGCGWNEVKGYPFKGKEVTIATNCLGCYNKKIGCFIEGGVK